MGAGKSKVGTLVADILGRPFVDTDELVEQRAGRAISDVFATDGEAAFRRMETETVAAALGVGANVIALGGGAATRQENWDLLRRAHALVVYLQAGPDTIYERVAGKGHRPLLAGLSESAKREKIAAMLAEREPWYLKADVVISSDDSRDKHTAAADVATKIRAAGIL